MITGGQGKDVLTCVLVRDNTLHKQKCVFNSGKEKEHLKRKKKKELSYGFDMRKTETRT